MENSTLDARKQAMYTVASIRTAGSRGHRRAKAWEAASCRSSVRRSNLCSGVECGNRGIRRLLELIYNLALRLGCYSIAGCMALHGLALTHRRAPQGRCRPRWGVWVTSNRSATIRAAPCPLGVLSRSLQLRHAATNVVKFQTSGFNELAGLLQCRIQSLREVLLEIWEGASG